MNVKLEKLREIWHKKRITILGFSREGKDTFWFLRKLFPKKVIGIADRRENLKLKTQSVKSQLKTKSFKNIKWHTGKNYLKSLKDYDVIIKSPGIPFKILPKSQLPKITTQTEIFFDNCPGKIVGITGTKGKSTTASLIYEVLKSGRARPQLVGNIGKPVLNLLLSSVKQSEARDETESQRSFSARPDNVYVYELSSFHLTNLKKSPHIAVFLNIYPEHLDYHKSFKEYADAKANITRYQTKNDYLIFNSSDKIINKVAKKSLAKKVPIKGVYYNLNKNAARAVSKIFKIPRTTVEKILGKFKTLPHRLEYVGKFRGIRFYNDALATIPEATIAALDFLGDDVETILLGGFDRGLSFKNLAERILKSKIKNMVLFPTTGEKIWKALQLASLAQGKILPKMFFIDKASNGTLYMKEAVKLAYQHTQKGKICLLSTASASFSIFKDYKEKGDLFKKYVKRFARNPALLKKGRG